MSVASDDTSILVVRPDRLGDVILSTPVFELLRKHYPRAKVSLLVQAQHVPILEGLSSIDRILTYEPEGKHQGLGGAFRLARELAPFKFRIALVLQSRWEIAFALFWARVRYRVGPLSKVHSYLFFNRGLRQRRSLVEMHEADYNLQLLRRIGVRTQSRQIETRIHVPDGARTQVDRWLDENSLGGKKFIAIHPGMGGSALNWPQSHYVDLIFRLAKEGRSVVVTGGPNEAALLDALREELDHVQATTPSDSFEKVRFFGGKKAGGIDGLAALFEKAAVVLAPSTGPLHVAVALGRPVVSFYPPIRVQSAIRWGPYLKEEKRAAVFVPDVYCGQDFECRGPACHYYPCMRSITVSEVASAVRERAPHEE